MAVSWEMECGKACSSWVKENYCPVLHKRNGERNAECTYLVLVLVELTGDGGYHLSEKRGRNSGNILSSVDEG